MSAHSQSNDKFYSDCGQVQNKAAALNSEPFTQRLKAENVNRRNITQAAALQSKSTHNEGKLEIRVTSGRQLAGESVENLERDSGVWASDSTLYRDTTFELDEYPTRENGDMYYGSHAQLSPGRGSINSLKDINPQDSTLSLFPDNDSGFSQTLKSQSRSGLFISDDFNDLSPRMSRSRSMTGLNLNRSQELEPARVPRYRPFDRTLTRLKDNLDDSENRRVVLVHKLKEAQETLELQNDRLNKIEGTAKTNTVLVDDLKYKEKEYRRKIDLLEQAEQEKEALKDENFRLRDEMQSRIDKLDYQLRNLQAQHQVAETENLKRSNLLEQTTMALSLLENENTKLQKDKETLKQEILVAKEAMELARHKFGPMEEENKRLQDEIDKVREEREAIARKSHAATSQLSELHNLTETMKEENEKLASSWKTLAEEKQKLSRELEHNQDGIRDSRSKVANLTSERDRLFTEKMEMNNKVQQLLLDKEQIEKTVMMEKTGSLSYNVEVKLSHLQLAERETWTKIAVEEQLEEQEEELLRLRKSVKRKDEDRRRAEEDYQDLKRNFDDLYKELSNTKAYYERSLEQISVLENNKQLAVQQQEVAEQEKVRLRADVERFREVAEGKTRDLKQEREQLEEAVLDLKGEVRQLRQDKSRADDKVQELEIKLQKANEDLKETTTLRQGEIDTLKSTCDRLSAGTLKKEQELQDYTDRIQQLEMQNERLKDDVKNYREECDQLAEQQEDNKKVKEENRRLLQEKAENEQVIKLLETQKEVLTKSAEANVGKLQDIEKLTEKIDQYRSENEHLRGRIGELEKVRDNLIKQKEELLANSELIYKKPQLEELEAKIEELRDANRQLREINEQVNEKAEMLGQEKLEFVRSQTAKLHSDTAGPGSHDTVTPLSHGIPVSQDILSHDTVSQVSHGTPLSQDMSHDTATPVSHDFITPVSYDTITPVSNLNTEPPAPDYRYRIPDNENTTLKDAIGGDGSVVPRIELERLSREKERLQSDFDHLKQDHENLEERHQRFIIQYGHDGSEAQKDKDEIERLNREKAALEQTVALINGQMLLVEGGKKRLDDVVDDLQTEIVSLRQQLEEAEKKHQMLSGPEYEAMQEQIDTLNEQLDESKYEQDKQRRLIQQLKGESLDDVGTELHEMRDELHKLMGVIESKDHAIETLENQLRTSKDQIKHKDEAMSDLQKVVSELENKNEELRLSVEGVRHSVEDKLLSPQRPTSPSPPRKLEDGGKGSSGSDHSSTRQSRPQDRGSDIIKRLKPAESYMKYKQRESGSLDRSEGKTETIPGEYGSQFISKQIHRSQSEKGGDRLQSLISKYRSYSEAGSQMPERKIKPLSLSPGSKMGLVTKGRSFGPAAPKSGDKVSVEAEAKSSNTECDTARVPNSEAIIDAKTALPIEASAQKISPQESSAMNGGAEDRLGESDGTFESSEGEDDDDYDEQKDINALIDSCYRTHLAFLRKLRKRGGRHSRSGGKKSASHPKPILSVSPPKITSRVIADLLKTTPTSGSTPSHSAPGSPGNSPSKDGKSLSQDGNSLTQDPAGTPTHTASAERL